MNFTKFTSNKKKLNNVILFKIIKKCKYICVCVFFGGGGGVNGGLLKVEKRKKPHASHVIQQKLVVGVANQFLDK